MSNRAYAGWTGDSLARLRLIYVSAPQLLDMEDGPERLREAYAIYLGEEDEPVPFQEARKHFRDWLAHAPKWSRTAR